MRWSVGVSYAPTFRNAAAEAVNEIRRELNGKRPTVALVFVSSHHAPSYYSVPRLIWEELKPKALIGASGDGVIGNRFELEGSPGLVVAAGILPGRASVGVFDLVEGEFPNMDGSPAEWRDQVGLPYSENSSMLIFADPSSINVQSFLEGLDFAYHDTFKSGALAAGGSQQGENALFINGDVKREGIVGLMFDSSVGHTGLTAQSCRPIGNPMIVTQTHKNTIISLNSSTPLDVLANCHQNGTLRDRELMEDSLTIGIAANEIINVEAPVEFMIRNINDYSELEGSIDVGELVREGQIVQFHLIDGEYAKRDLHGRLKDYSLARHESPPELALLFPCRGRGRQMFGTEGYESAQLRNKFTDVLIAGFFCNGQIMTVGGGRNTADDDGQLLHDQLRTTTRLLGYTSVTSLLSPVRREVKRKRRRRIVL